MKLATLALTICLFTSCTKNLPKDYNWASSIILNPDSVKTLENDFEQFLRDSSSTFNIKYAQVVWRYRDPKVIPYLREILLHNNIHFQCMAIRTLGRIESEEAISLLKEQYHTNIEVKKSYAILALSRSTLGLAFLHERAKTDDSSLLRKMTQIDFSTIKESPFIGLPITSKDGFRKEPFVYKKVSDDEGNSIHEIVDSTDAALSEAPCAPPTPQFLDSLPSTPRLDNYWIPSLELNHCGYDNSWDWQGLPVYSASSGIVRLVWFDASWGVMVAIESLVDGENVLLIYGHLDSRLFISAGQFISTGQIIGEIGGATTIVNGGYRAHLHFGIERCKFPRCSIRGYDDQESHWINPRDFIIAHEG